MAVANKIYNDFDIIIKYDKIILLFVMLICYHSTLTSYYFFHDDYTELFNKDFIYNNVGLNWIFLASGRPLKWLIMYFNINYVQSSFYSYIAYRAIMFILTYTFALIVMFIINKITNNKLYSLGITSILFIIPSFAIYPLWADMTIVLPGYYLSALSFYLLFTYFQNENNKLHKKALIVLLSLIINTIAGMIYQVATILPAFFLLIYLLTHNKNTAINNIKDIIKEYHFTIVAISLIIATQLTYIASMLAVVKSIKYLNIFPIQNHLFSQNRNDIDTESSHHIANIIISMMKPFFTHYFDINFLYLWAYSSYQLVNLIIVVITFLLLITTIVLEIKNSHHKINTITKWLFVVMSVAISGVFLLRETSLRVGFISSWCWVILIFYSINYISEYIKKQPIKLYSIIYSIILICGTVNATIFTHQRSLGTLSVQIPLIEHLNSSKNIKNILLITSYNRYSPPPTITEYPLSITPSEGQVISQIKMILYDIGKDIDNYSITVISPDDYNDVKNLIDYNITTVVNTHEFMNIANMEVNIKKR